MANETIYPFGQGGSLPSGYPIADDLNTNSAQQALSAKQGVVLKGMVEDSKNVRKEIDLSFYNGILGNYINYTNNVWASTSGTNSFFVPIISGHTYEITAGANTARVAILKSKDDTIGDTPDYATGETALRLIAANQTLVFTAPSDANYLSINKTLNNTDIQPASMYDVLLQEDYQKKYTDESVAFLRGTFDNEVVFSDLSVSSNGSSSQITISKDGNGGILIDNKTSTSGKYALIALPSSLVSGRKYRLSFKYMSCFGTNDSWYLRFVDSSYNATSGGVDLERTDESPKIASLYFVHKPENAYLRLASTNQSKGAKVYITEFSISEKSTDVANLSTRVKNLEEGNDTFVGYAYEGEKIKLNPQNKYNVEQIASNGTSGQSAALYDKYLFIVKDKFTSVVLYNIETRTTIYTLNTGQSVNTWHCNQSSFGSAKYDEDDMFPVLYISQRPESGSERCIVQVYRIIPTLTDDAITSFSMTLVQTINLPALTEQNGLGLANATIDTENGWMWTYSRNTTSGQSTTGLATFTKFTIPALFDGGGNAITTVTLEDSDIKDSFMERWYIYNNQGAFIHNGKMYMMRGVPSSDHFCECNVIDLYFQRMRVSRVDLYPNGFSSEPEGCFYYDNTVCFTVNGASIYRIVFN